MINAHFSHKKHRLTRTHWALLTLLGLSEATKKERRWGWKRASLFSCLWKGKDKIGLELGTELITATCLGKDLPGQGPACCHLEWV